MASNINNMSSDPENAHDRVVWGWNSINSFVENTKTASESFFDNVTATLSKKPDHSTHIHPTLSLASTNPALPTAIDTTNTIQSGPQDWKSKYIELKHAHTLKTAMLHNELQKYKTHNVSFKRHISLHTESKIAKLEAQISKYQQNEAKCMRTWSEHMRHYHQNIDCLQHEMENKYKIFYEKLLNVTIKAGLNPKHIFEPMNKDADTISVNSDFEEKEQIHNAEECIETPHHTEKATHHPQMHHDHATMDEKENQSDNRNNNEYKMTELQTQHETQMVELKCKLREVEASLGQYRTKFFDLVQKNEDLKQNNQSLTHKVSALNADSETHKEQYDELEALFSSMSDQNTDFQQQIKDVEGENALLRQQLNEHKAQNQKEMEAFMVENAKGKESLHRLEVRYAEISNKLENEYEMSQQLREQIKSISKALNKKTKSNAKQKRKMEAMGKKIEAMQYTAQEHQRKITKYVEQIAELESEQSKYNNAISQYKALQQEIESYIDDNYELRTKLNDAENELTVIKEHGDELRKQSRRDSKNISRLTQCNDELIAMTKQCEEILIENAHQYLPISLINAHELECTDSEDDEEKAVYKRALVTNDSNNNEKKNNQNFIIYFNDESDSDLMEEEKEKESEEDDIWKASKEKDQRALQMGVRLKIQISMLSEQLGKFQKDINHFKRELHRKEEQSMRQQHELRQIAIQKRLHAQVRKELGKRERDMISIASVRGVNMRHKTSLAKLTQTQDRVKSIMNKIQDKNQSFKHNIAMQLSGNYTKARAMTVSDSTLSASSVQSVKSRNNNENNKTNRNHYNPFYLSENDGYEEDDGGDAFKLETQSMHSCASDRSKRSVHSQSAISLNTHYRHNKRKTKRSRLAMQPMQTVQSQQTTRNANKSPKKISFSNRWY